MAKANNIHSKYSDFFQAERWALRFPSIHSSEILRIRNTAGVWIAADGKYVWLHGTVDSPKEKAEQTLKQLRQIPDGRLFVFKNDESLRIVGEKLSSTRLPQLAFQRLNEVIEFELPPTRMPGRISSRVSLSLVRSATIKLSKYQQPSAIFGNFNDWHQWVEQSNNLRLKPLQFACDKQHRVLIVGNPLPSIRGQQFCKFGNVYVPAGWCWNPGVSIELLNKIVGATNETQVWALQDNSWLCIPTVQFVAASRSAVRLTAEQWS